MSYTESERKLTNDDFRKLFMTPRHGDKPSSSSHHTSSTADFATPAPPDSAGSTIRRHHHDKEKHDKRKKKKQFYSKIKREEDEQMAELARKYRDRAKERRDGGAPENKSEDLITAQGAYRAVAPDFRANVNAAERRKQMIQESKFLGGDMEHTHLVKGLDYALLQKVKSELDTKDEELEEAADVEPAEDDPKPKKDIPKPSHVPEQEGGFRTKLAKNIHRVLFNTAPPERNELFAVGRMAYVMDLEDEYAESDVPHTLIRSKADVPNAQGQATLTTNDIVINKLAQILSYLRSGSKSSKKNRKITHKGGKSEETDMQSDVSKQQQEEDSIYGDIGDYVPTKTKSSAATTNSARPPPSAISGAGNRGKYFEKPGDDEDRGVVIEMPKISRDEYRKQDREAWNADGANKQTDQTFGSILKKEEKSQTKAQKLMSKMNAQPEGYAECYPGFDEMHDAIDDSDDDFDQTDFSKMDPGKKKGNVGRWDFDSVEEYSEYMSNKEALPKAAFQFGVKMNDGRKTRTKVNKAEKNEKAHLDRQWNQIQQIMSKRKGEGAGEEPIAKTPRN